MSGVRRPPQALRIETADRYPLSVRHFPASEVSTAGRERVAIFLNATGVSQQRYHALASYVADSGWHALTFDYRGIGESAVSLARPPAAARGVSMRAWGQWDLAGLITWADARFDTPSIALICHSIGGQVAALASNAHRVDAMLAVACQKGYWRLWPDWRRYAVFAFFQWGVPLCLRLFGHVPLQWLRLHGLEPGVARDYARWTLHDNYADARGRMLDAAHRRFRAPILSLSFDDDGVYAPKPTVDALAQGYYVNAPVIRAHLPARDYAARGLGHSGFFDAARCPRGLWRECVQWLSHVAAGGHPHAFEFLSLPAYRYR